MRSQVIAELEKNGGRTCRSQLALMRCGSASWRCARRRGRVDAEELKNEGQRLISDLSHEIQLRIADMGWQDRHQPEQ